MNKACLVLLFVLFFTVALTSCVGGTTGIDQVKTGDFVEVEWAQINPPPNTEGPCYAYFTKSFFGGYAGYGFSGVYCSGD